MVPRYLDDTDLLDARLELFESSRRAARLRRRLEAVCDEMEDASSRELRSLALPRWGDRRAVARWQGELTQGPWDEPKPIYVEVEDPKPPLAALAPACPTPLQREVSSAVTCLLGLTRSHEAEIRRLRSKLRKQRRGNERLEKRVEALEPAPVTALVPAPDAPAVAAATDGNRIAAVIAAVASVPLLEMTLLYPLTHDDRDLVQLSGHLMAIGLSVVVFYLVERLLSPAKPVVVFYLVERLLPPAKRPAPPERTRAQRDGAAG